VEARSTPLVTVDLLPPPTVAPTAESGSLIATLTLLLRGPLPNGGDIAPSALLHAQKLFETEPWRRPTLVELESVIALALTLA